MSASWDKDQKIKFVFSNLYETYRKGRAAARDAEVGEAPSESPATLEGSFESRELRLENSRILQAAQVRPGLTLRPGWTIRPEWAVREHRPVEFLQPRRNPAKPEAPRVVPGRRAPTPASAPAAPSAATVLRLQTALAGQAQAASVPLEKLERNLDALSRLQKRIGFLIREIETLSKGSRRDDRE